MSTQRGNVKKTGPPKHVNKRAWKNVYHDTSKQTQKIVTTEISGVCSRCKEVIDWKIKYKKYKPLTQPKTCVVCKKKTVRHAYHVYCQECSATENKCAKCGDKKELIKPSLSSAEQARQDSELQMELQMLPERKRRTFLRLQEKGLLPTGDGDLGDNDDDTDEEEEEEDCSDSETCAQTRGDAVTTSGETTASDGDDINGNNLQSDKDTVPLEKRVESFGVNG